MKKLSKNGADIFVSDGLSLDKALRRTTHLGIGAHSDDLEIMAYSAIDECFDSEVLHFSGITVTDGCGSFRTGAYSDLSDDEFVDIRCNEQRVAAETGNYSSMIQFNYASSELKNRIDEQLIDDLCNIMLSSRPDIVFTHNPFDAHVTHIAVLIHTIEALRRISCEFMPRRLLGGEVWGSLDWIPEKNKIALKADRHPDLAKELLSIFKSQIDCGKHYDRAVIARREANATFFNPRKPDECSALIYAVELTSLITDSNMILKQYVNNIITDFQNSLHLF